VSSGEEERKAPLTDGCGVPHVIAVFVAGKGDEELSFPLFAGDGGGWDAVADEGRGDGARSLP